MKAYPNGLSLSDRLVIWIVGYLGPLLREYVQGGKRNSQPLVQQVTVGCADDDQHHQS